MQERCEQGNATSSTSWGARHLPQVTCADSIRHLVQATTINIMYHVVMKMSDCVDSVQ